QLVRFRFARSNRRSPFVIRYLKRCSHRFAASPPRALLRAWYSRDKGSVLCTNRHSTGHSHTGKQALSVSVTHGNPSEASDTLHPHPKRPICAPSRGGTVAPLVRQSSERPPPRR